MGATLITRYGQGLTMAEAFKRVQEEDRDELGSDYYSGGTHHTHLTAKVSNSKVSNIDELEAWVQKNGSKGNAYGVVTSDPVVNKNKIKSVVTDHPQEGTRKWETVYVAQEKYGKKVVGSARFKKDAIDKARKHTEKTKKPTEVLIKKVLPTSQVTVCAEVNYKPAKDEREGHYMFAAWAPC
jgi:hypothetical protein